MPSPVPLLIPPLLAPSLLAPLPLIPSPLLAPPPPLLTPLKHPGPDRRRLIHNLHLPTRRTPPPPLHPHHRLLLLDEPQMLLLDVLRQPLNDPLVFEELECTGTIVWLPLEAAFEEVAE